MAEERIYKLYCHTNRVNGKKYFGITRRSLSRRFGNGKGYKSCTYFQHAIEFYGWDCFSHEVVMDGLTKEEAELAEKEYIAKYRTRDKRYGYNIQSGGLSTGEVSKEGQRIGAEKRSGANAFNAIDTCVFDKKGNFLGRFPTAKDAALHVGVNQKTATHSVRYGGFTESGYLFIPYCDRPIESDLSEDELQPHLPKPIPSGDEARHRVEVYVFSHDGKFIDFFLSQRSAAKKYGVSISCVCDKMKSLGEASIGVYFRGKDFSSVSQLSDSDLLDHRLYAKKAKGVAMFNSETGKFITWFPTVSKANEITGGLSGDCLYRGFVSRKYYFQFAESPAGISDIPVEDIPKPDKYGGRAKKVSQYDLNGNFIKTYDAALCAASETGISFSSISNAVTGKTKTAGGFQWRYADVDPSTVTRVKSTSETRWEKGNYNAKSVLQIDPKSGVVVSRYRSLHEAEKKSGISRYSIALVAEKRNNRQTAGGYCWEYDAS